MEKKMIVRYLVLILIFVGLIGGLLVLRNVDLTGYAVYEATADERGACWNKVDNGDGSYSLVIYNNRINYFDGGEYVPIVYGSCGSNCFRDWNGLIYRVSGNQNYINLFSPDDDYISSFGFGITGSILGMNYKYTTLNFTWTWSQEHIAVTDEYIFRAYNNNPNFNWTQEFHFYPNQSMKIKNIVKNDLGVNIQNTKFWYIQTVGAEDGIWFNGTKYNQDTYKTGEFDSLLPRVKFEDYCIFEYDDLLDNGFNITDFYLGEGDIIGVSGVRILAIGITRGNSVFPNGVSVTVDPTVKISGDGGDSYVKSAGDANKNFGTSTILKTGDTARVYFLFNISAIPENQKIDKASLCSYVRTKKEQLINTNHVYVDFDESTITWNNQPCGTGFDNPDNCNLTAGDSVQIDASSQNTWKCWNVPEMVGKDYDDGNGDVAIALHTGDSDINEFYSKEYSDNNLWPYLNVTYSLSDIGPPEIVLNFPIGFINSEEVIFSYTPTDLNLDSCELWGDFTGSWSKNQTDTNVTSNETNSFNLNLTESSYLWAIWCNDTLGNSMFSDNETFTIDTISPNLSLSEPAGAKTSRTVAAEWSASDNNLETCWYGIYQGTSPEIPDTLVNCSLGTETFEVNADASFTFNFYANDSAGNINSTSSEFSVDTSTPSQPSSSSGGSSGGGTLTVSKLEIKNISNLVIDPGESKRLILGVKNTGNKFFNDCKVRGLGENAAWISSEETRGLSVGEEYDFIFTLNIPEILEAGSYEIGVGLVCQEYNKSINFNAEIIKKELTIDLISVEREKDDRVKIVYSLTELSGYEQEVEVEIILFGHNNERLAELIETKSIKAGSRQEFKTDLKIQESLAGSFNLLINVISDTDSTFVQEDIILGSSGVGGLAIFGRDGGGNIFSVILIVLFVIFTIFIVRRIFKLKKLKKGAVRA